MPREKNWYADENLIRFKDLCLSQILRKQSTLEKYEKYYFQGSEFSKSDVNKIFGEINSIASLIFSPEKIILEARVEDQNIPLTHRKLLDALTEKVLYNFYTAERLDIVLEEAVKKSIYYGYSIIKAYWKDDTRSVVYREIEPYNFSVMYESLPLTDPQQVILHRTYMTGQLIKKKYGISVAYDNAVIGRGSAKGKILNIAKDKAVLDVTAGTDEEFWKSNDAMELNPVYELWINEYPYTLRKQWHKFIIIDEKIVDHVEWKILGHPFFILFIYPSRNEVYGMSLIEQLEGIQETRNQKLRDIDNLTNLLLYPPLIVTGTTMSKDMLKEEVNDFYTPKGSIVLSDPTARAQLSPPNVELGAAYEQINFFDMQVKYITGLQEILLGEKTSGARATGMADILAQFASAQFRSMAHRLQAQLEEIFTYTAQLFQFNDKTPVRLKDEQDKNFYYSMIPYDYRMEVKGYSASPIMAKENMQIAFELLKAGLLPPDLFIDIINLPYSDRIKAYLEEQKKMLAMQQAANATKEGGDNNGKEEKK